MTNVTLIVFDLSDRIMLWVDTIPWMIVTEPVWVPGARSAGFTVITSKPLPVPLGVAISQLPVVVDMVVCQGELFGTVMGMVRCSSVPL